MPRATATSQSTRAATELLGLSGSYLQMRHIPQHANARINAQLGSSIQQSLRGWQQPMEVDLVAPLAFEEFIETDVLSDETGSGLLDEDNPFSSGNGTDDTSFSAPDMSAYQAWPALVGSPDSTPSHPTHTHLLGSYTNDGSYSDGLTVAPQDLQFPWNLSSTSPPNVLPMPAPAAQSAPRAKAAPPAPAVLSMSELSGLNRPGRSVAYMKAPLSPSESPSPLASFSASTPLSDSKTGSGRTAKGKRRIPLDAPIQQRTYHGPSRTSKRTLPRGFEKNLEPEKVAGFKRALEAVENEEAGSDEEDLVKNVTTKVVQKREKNTLAARKSRAKRAEYLEQLEKMLSDREQKVLNLEKELRDKDTEIRVLKQLVYQEEEHEDD